MRGGASQSVSCVPESCRRFTQTLLRSRRRLVSYVLPCCYCRRPAAAVTACAAAAPVLLLLLLVLLVLTSRTRRLWIL